MDTPVLDLIVEGVAGSRDDGYGLKWESKRAFLVEIIVRFFYK